jgi:aryl-alcohol dehydrogenase-like predicted oxidoreductase
MGMSDMKKRKLGTSGLEVSAIGFGCMGLNYGLGPGLPAVTKLTDFLGRAL